MYKLSVLFVSCFLLLTFHTGELVSTLNKHKGPIMSLKWNKKGNYLVSGSIDTTVVAWNVKSGESKQQFDFHSGVLSQLFFILYLISKQGQILFCFAYVLIVVNPM